MIDIYIVLKGTLTISTKSALVKMEANTLYWTFSDRRPMVNVARDTEGYVIRYHKALLRSTRDKTCCSLIDTFFPFAGKGDYIRLGTSFLNESRTLCEMMLEEYKSASDFKIELLRSLLSIFVLYLIRKEDIVMYGPNSELIHSTFYRNEADRHHRVMI